MLGRNGVRGVLAAAVLLLATSGPASAARARFHYVVGPDGCRMVLQPVGAGGERITIFGVTPDATPPPVTHLVTFDHEFTGQRVTVPLNLPSGTPVIEHRYRRYIYNYGSYTVEVVFLPDGSVDVVYNSGLLRAI